MPNQEWFKEKINDPSARVLSNYQTKKGKLWKKITNFKKVMR
jgi:hypothetical protein